MRILSATLSFLFSGLLSVLISCSSDDLPDSFKLETFRVLALVADSPEVQPGQTVALQPFLSDINGGGRNITITVESCLDPGVTFGATPECGQTDSQVVHLSQVDVTGLSAPNYTGLAGPTVNVTIPNADIIFAQKSAVEQFNGVGYLVTFIFSLPDGSKSRAFRQIQVTSKTALNTNPSYNGPPAILGNNQRLDQLPSAEIPIRVDLDDTAGETYEEILDGENTITREENLETNWFISDGDLSTSISDFEESVDWTPPTSAPSDRDAVIVAVTRDGRGGIAATFITIP